MKNRAAGMFLALLLAVGLCTIPDPASAALKSVKGEAPTLTGEFYGGGLLRINTGSWTLGAKLTYKWRLDGTVIPKAVAKTLSISDNFVGHEIGVDVTGSKSGMKPTTLSSEDYPIGIIDVTNAPTISGQLAVGAALTLSDCNCSPQIQSKQIQWYKDGVAIPGASSSSYILTSNDYGSVFSAQIVMSVPGFQPVTVTTRPTEKLLQPVQVLSKPSISYTALATSNTFSVQPGTYNPSGVALTYQWLADGQAIAGQTGSSFTPDASFGGKSLSVSVMATANGYSPAIQTTAAVGPLLTVKTYTSGHLDGYTYFLNCGGSGYRTCDRDSYGISGNSNGVRLYSGIFTSDAVLGMFGVNMPDIDPSKVLRWRVTTKGYSGVGVDRPGIMAATSSSWTSTIVSTMSLVESDGVATSNWYTTPMGGSNGHSLYWGIFNSKWGSYYVDYFVVEVQYYG